MTYFTKGQNVEHRHSTASEWIKGVVTDVKINEYLRGKVWEANSYYTIATDRGIFITDLVDAHHTFGGMTKAA